MSELSRLADQPRGVSQRAHGNRAVVGRHAAEFVASDERGLRPEVGSAQCGHDAGWPAADYDHIHV